MTKSLGLATGKRITPHLSALMGPWLAAQHDASPEVATAAVDAFESVFSKAERRTKALSVCFDAIAEHAHDYAVVQTTSSLADTQSFTMDEHEKSELYVNSVVYHAAKIPVYIPAVGCNEHPYDVQQPFCC